MNEAVVMVSDAQTMLYRVRQVLAKVAEDPAVRMDDCEAVLRAETFVRQALECLPEPSDLEERIGPKADYAVTSPRKGEVIDPVF